MNENLQNVLAALAEKFGTSVEHLWGVMIRQATISGYASLFNLLLFMAGCYVWWRWAKWYLKQETDKFDFMSEVGHPVGIGFMAIALGIGCFAVVPSEAYNAVTAFLNPEYWALRQILK